MEIAGQQSIPSNESMTFKSIIVHHVAKELFEFMASIGLLENAAGTQSDG